MQQSPHFEVCIDHEVESEKVEGPVTMPAAAPAVT
jgi:hypothetical protein